MFTVITLLISIYIILPLSDVWCDIFESDEWENRAIKFVILGLLADIVAIIVLIRWLIIK